MARKLIFVEEIYPDKYIMNAESFLDIARLGAANFNCAIQLSKESDLSSQKRERSDKWIKLAFPISANAGFSTELSLKAISIVEQQKFCRNHNLEELFDQLGSNSKEEISTGVPMDITELESALEQLRHVFEETRYIEPHRDNKDSDGNPKARSLSPLDVNVVDSIAGAALKRAKYLAIEQRRAQGR